MAHSNLFTIFEILSFVAFVAIITREAYQKNYRRIYEIISCAIFGMILEIGNTYLAHTYYYGNSFVLKILDIPLAIGFGWAVIIYCVMLMSDQYRLPWTLRPFIDALTAIALDLAMDPIAIRLGFWHWSIPLNQEWYGVPFENLVGWILVVLIFSFVIRFIRTLNPKRVLTDVLMVASPIISYIGLVIGLALFGIITAAPYSINNWGTWLNFNYRPDFSILYNADVQFWKTILFTILLVELINISVGAMVRYRKKYLHHFDLLSFMLLSGLHLFFMFAVFQTGIWRTEPILALLSIAMFLAHCLLHFLPYLYGPSAIYFFRTAGHSLKTGEKQLEKFIDTSMR